MCKVLHVFFKDVQEKHQSAIRHRAFKYSIVILSGVLDYKLRVYTGHHLTAMSFLSGHKLRTTFPFEVVYNEAACGSSWLQTACSLHSLHSCAL